jgi:hypothetical protein
MALGKRYQEFSSQAKAEGFIDGVVFANSGDLQISGLFVLPNGKHVVEVQDDAYSDDDLEPVEWRERRKIDYK